MSRKKVNLLNEENSKKKNCYDAQRLFLIINGSNTIYSISNKLSDKNILINL